MADVLAEVKLQHVGTPGNANVTSHDTGHVQAPVKARIQLSNRRHRSTDIAGKAHVHDLWLLRHKGSTHVVWEVQREGVLGGFCMHRPKRLRASYILVAGPLTSPHLCCAPL